MTYLLHIGVLVCFYVVLASSLNILAGSTGMLSMAHAAFYGLGAYAAGLLALRWGIPFPLDVIAALCVVGLLALVAAVASVRTRGDYFVLGTFAFQMIVFNVLNDWIPVTGGPLGMAGIPRPMFFGTSIEEPWEYLVFSALIAILLTAFIVRVDRGPLGRVLRAIRDDEVLAESIGIDVRRTKILVFVVAAMAAGGVGGLYAHYTTFIAPSNFTVQESIFILAIVIVGGAGSTRGAVIGAVILVTAPELLRLANVSSMASASLRQVLYGLLLIATIIVRPQGIAGEYDFRR